MVFMPFRRADAGPDEWRLIVQLSDEWKELSTSGRHKKLDFLFGMYGALPP